MNSLVFEHVSKRYQDKYALRDFSTVMHPGIYGILGPNGAGKSTLMNLLTDSIARTEGKILYNGQEICAMGARFRGKVGYMPQHLGIYEHFTASRFLYYMADLKGLKKREAREEVPRYLELVGLSPQAGKRVGKFSGGMSRRLMFAASLIGNPEILILDEPTAGLDPEERIRIRNYISESAREKIVLLATHVVSDIECIAGEVLMIRRGELIGRGSPSELIASVEGKVAEIACTMETAQKLQRTYRVGNISQRKDGLVLRLVGDDLPPEMPRVTVGLNLEDVYLYYLEDDKGR